MNSIFVNFIETVYRPTIEECEKFCCIVRGIEFQKEAVKKIEDLKIKLMDIKTSMIQIQDEDAANCCLSLEKVASAKQHEFRLWIALKEDRMRDAWDDLVNAESSTNDAIIAHDISAPMVENFKRLKTIEELLFPHMIFVSPGFIILSSRCTICGCEYGSCDHLKGLPYMGEICAREITKTRIQEISIVNDPANRHARMIAMEIDGVKRDMLTWREEPGDINK